MSIRLTTIALATACAAFLCNQGNASAGFMVEHGDAWHAVGDDVASGSTAPEGNETRKASSSELTRFYAQFLIGDPAHFGRLGCNAPGGMSSSSSDSASQSATMFLAATTERQSPVQNASWLRIEGAPSLPPPLATTILQPPRA